METSENYTISTERGQAIDNDAYHAMPGISSSRLKVFMDDVRRYQHQFLSGKYTQERKAHFDFGTSVHDLVLLGDSASVLEIPSDVLAANGAKSGKLWWAFAAEHADAILLKSAEYRALHNCVDAIMSHPVAGRLIGKTGVCERAFVTHDEQLGLSLRCKPDKLLDNNVVVDLKTTAAGTKAGKFVKNIINFGYHYQEHFYRRVLAASGIEVQAFVFIAVQVDEPHTVDCYTLSPDFRQKAEADVENALLELSERMKADDWLARNHEMIVDLEPPNWLQYRGEYDV